MYAPNYKKREKYIPSLFTCVGIGEFHLCDKNGYVGLNKGSS
jgi:hypothetical protein